MKHIYAQKYNCELEAWRVSKGIVGTNIQEDKGIDNYQIDREELIDKFEKEQSNKGNVFSELQGDIDTKINNLIEIIRNENDIKLKNIFISNKNYYTKVKYLIKKDEKITIYFLELKEFEKIDKDWNAKAAFCPKLFTTIDMMYFNFGNDFEVEYQLITLEEDGTYNYTLLYNNKTNEKVSWFDKEHVKHKPVFFDLSTQEEPEIKHSRNCKKCQFRNECGVPKRSILELEVTSQCWRNTKKIIDDIGSLDIGKMEQKHIDMLNNTQKGKLNAYNSNNGIYINKEIITSFLDKIKDGYVSFDFETFSSILPPSSKYKQYAQIPFSYSLDIVKPESGITHRHCIVHYNESDYGQLYEKLKKDMPNDMPIVVYFKSFEISRLKEFQELYPSDFDLIQGWIDNIVDLYEVFESGGYYDIRFNDSCSLKNVYPVLADSKQYDYLNINNGEKAMIEYKKMVNYNNGDFLANEKMLEDLIEYNRQDTQAQIDIIVFLKNLKKLF